MRVGVAQEIIEDGSVMVLQMLNSPETLWQAGYWWLMGELRLFALWNPLPSGLI